MSASTETSLPRDLNSEAIQVLAPGTSVTADPAAIGTLPTGSEIVRVTSDGDVWFSFTNAAAAEGADSFLFLKGTEVLRVPSDATQFDTVAFAGGTLATKICVTRLI